MSDGRHLDDIAILREHVDDMRPNPCCKGKVMREAGKSDSVLCDENCDWAKLDRLIANVSVTISGQQDRIRAAITGLDTLSDQIRALGGKGS